MTTVRVIMTWGDDDDSRPVPAAVVPDEKDDSGVELHWCWLERNGYRQYSGKVWVKAIQTLYGSRDGFAAVSDPMEVQQ